MNGNKREWDGRELRLRVRIVYVHQLFLEYRRQGILSPKVREFEWTKDVIAMQIEYQTI